MNDAQRPNSWSKPFRVNIDHTATKILDHTAVWDWQMGPRMVFQHPKPQTGPVYMVSHQQLHPSAPPHSSRVAEEAIPILNYGLLNIRGGDYNATNLAAAQMAMSAWSKEYFFSPSNRVFDTPGGCRSLLGGLEGCRKFRPEDWFLCPDRMAFFAKSQI